MQFVVGTFYWVVSEMLILKKGEPDLWIWFMFHGQLLCSIGIKDYVTIKCPTFE